jgi:hypothetical protein
MGTDQNDAFLTLIRHCGASVGGGGGWAEAK